MLYKLRLGAVPNPMVVLEAYEKWGSLVAVLLAATVAVPERENRFQELAYSYPVARWTNLLEKIGVAFGTYLVLTMTAAWLLKTGYKDLSTGKLLFYALPPAWVLVTLALLGSVLTGHTVGGLGCALPVWLFNYYAGYRFTGLTYLFLASNPVEDVDLILNRSILMALGGVFLTLALIFFYLDGNRVGPVRVLKVFSNRFWSDLPRWGEDGRKILLTAIIMFFIGPLLFSAARPLEVSGPIVDCAIIRGREIPVRIQAPGQLMLAEPVNVTAPETGSLIEITVTQGQWVKRGQVLARYDDEDLLSQEEVLKAELTAEKESLKQLLQADQNRSLDQRLMLEGLEANIASAEAKVQDLEQLYNLGGIPLNELENARQEHANFQREYRRARLQINADSNREIDRVRRLVQETTTKLDQVRSAIKEKIIISPQEGQVLRLEARSGQAVAKGAPVLLLRSDNRLKARVTVPPEKVGRLQLGQQALIKVGEDDPGVLGQVVRMGVIIENPGAGKPGVPVEMLLQKEISVLRPETPVQVEFDLGRKEILAVPQNALLRKGREESVWVISEGKVFQRPVYTGPGDEDYRAVIDGLEPGDTVVINPSKSLKDGKRVYDKQQTPEKTLVSIEKKDNGQK